MATKRKVATPFEPSKTAMAKFSDALPVPTVCHYCRGEVVIVHHRDVYDGRSFGNWPWMYRCQKCLARVGIHPRTNIPLGTLADEATRNARKYGKVPFQALWDGPKASMSRETAYAWLASALGIDPKVCHFAMFDAAMCNRARDLSKAKTS